VAIPAGIAGFDRVEQIDEGVAAAFVSGEAEDLAAPDV
jgi:hypothetical protein